jgi:hypothetical protein
MLICLYKNPLQVRPWERQEHSSPQLGLSTLTTHDSSTSMVQLNDFSLEKAVCACVHSRSTIIQSSAHWSCGAIRTRCHIFLVVSCTPDIHETVLWVCGAYPPLEMCKIPDIHRKVDAWVDRIMTNKAKLVSYLNYLHYILLLSLHFGFLGQFFMFTYMSK